MSTPDNHSHLQSLYPFLHSKASDATSVNQSLLDSIERKMAQHQQIVNTFFTDHHQAIVDCAKAIASVYRQHGQLFTLGNGGSSCDASHIAVEFLHPVTTGRPALPAYDLSCDKTLMTAIANDVGFEHVYARQLANLMKKRDALIGVSTSGNSDNLVRAFAEAQKIGATTIALTGGDGGHISTMGLDHCLTVASDSIHRIQECHVAIYHVLWDLVHTLLADVRGNLHTTIEQNNRTE